MTATPESRPTMDKKPSIRYVVRLPNGKQEMLRAVKIDPKHTVCTYAMGKESPLYFTDENHAWAMCCAIQAICGRKHEAVKVEVSHG